MGIVELLGGSGSADDEEGDETTYWCTVCGMMFERSCLRIDYSWCTRCGAEGVWKLPWPTPE
jgi:hypothetical protein